MKMLWFFFVQRSSLIAVVTFDATQKVKYNEETEVFVLCCYDTADIYSFYFRVVLCRSCK